MLGAVILAAGQSSRMGEPKLCLPWLDGRPMIVDVVRIYLWAGVPQIVVVTGGDREKIEAALSEEQVSLVFNSRFAQGEMLSSIKIGLRALQGEAWSAALIAPGDMPEIRVETVQALIQAFQDGAGPIVAPSYMGRRGHPILIGREEWKALLSHSEQGSLRSFLGPRNQIIRHLELDDPGILRDIDTPEDYKRMLEAGE